MNRIGLNHAESGLRQRARPLQCVRRAEEEFSVHVCDGAVDRAAAGANSQHARGRECIGPGERVAEPAAKLAHLTEVPIEIREATDRDVVLLRLEENFRRVGLNAIDQALAFQAATAPGAGFTQKELADSLGLTQGAVSNKIRLLKAPEGLRTLGACLQRLHAITPPKGVAALDPVSIATGLAQAILESHPDIDIALIDIMMPEMDGYETMQQIRRIPAIADVPLISVTAKAMKGDRQKCLNAGASDYIAKPVDIDLLLALLRVWVARSRERPTVEFTRAAAQ